MATPLTQFMTAEELERLDSEQRFDLIRGELHEMSPAGAKHGRVANRIAFLLSGYVEDHDAGELFSSETGFILARDPDIVLAPDVAFVRAARFPPELDDVENFLELAPDLVVEVASPGDDQRRRAEKIEFYLGSGVSLVWIVEPRRRQVTVYTPNDPPRTLSAADTLDGGDILPDLALIVEDLFPRRRSG
jgi:Uma2 family endonuclease